MIKSKDDKWFFPGNKRRVCNRMFVDQFKNGSSESRRLPLACNQWKCEICREYKIAYLSRCFKEGVSLYLEKLKEDGLLNLYSTKLLTLTWPGKERRCSKYSRLIRPDYCGNEETDSPLQAQKEMWVNWNKLNTYLNKYYGSHAFIGVMEQQEDGYPHLHVLLMGGGIGNRKILSDVRKLWVYKYGMGNVDLEVIRKGYRAGVNYIIKYLTKAPALSSGGVRVYSYSRNLLPKKIKAPVNLEWSSYQVGSLTEDYKGDYHAFPYWSVFDRDYSKVKESNLEVRYDDVVPF